MEHLSLVTAVTSVVEASISPTSLPAFSFSSHLVLFAFQLFSARENCHCGKSLEPSILTMFVYLVQDTRSFRPYLPTRALLIVPSYNSVSTE